MTQYTGFYCPSCRIRYVAHVCKEGLPCGHSKDEALYCWRWDYTGGYKEILIKNKKRGIHFFERNVSRMEAVEDFEKYVELFQEFEDHGQYPRASVIRDLRGAFANLGGRGARFPPKWREKELRNQHIEGK